MKAKILGEHNCVKDEDYDNTYEGSRKWHYELTEGDIVEVNMNIKADSMDVRNTPEGMCYLCKHHNKYEYLPITWLDVDFSKKDIDWEQRRYELAKAAISTAWSVCVKYDYNTSKYSHIGAEDIANESLYIADAIIKQLKSET